MSITNYSELQAALPEWMIRPGDSTVTAQAPDYITLCEARLNYGAGEPGDQFYSPPLRVNQMLTRSTASLSSEYVAVPDDFLEVRTFKVNTNPETKLYYSTPDQFAEAGSSQSSGVPKTFTIAGDEFRFGPAPSSDLTAELWYYAKIPALSDSNTSNWLLAAAPNIYLYGSLLEAALAIGDDAGAQKWLGLFSSAVKAFQAQDKRAKHGSTPLVMRPVTQTP